MTPRVDKDFSEELLRRASSDSLMLDFRKSAPLFPIEHPLVLKAQLSHADNPQQEHSFQASFLHWNLFCFQNASELSEGTLVERAHPHLVARILREQPVEIALGFDQLGCVILTQNKMLLPTSAGIHQTTLPLILNYTFSPDLWAPHGKWTLFHERLQKAFEKAGLLLDSLPGTYILNSKALKLRDFGYSGDEKDDQFVFTLPWTFSLSQLVKLESLLQQEF